MNDDAADKLTLGDPEDDLRVQLIDDFCYTPGSADNVHQYELVHHLEPRDQPRFTAQVGVRVERDGDAGATCIVIAHSGARMPLDRARVVHKADLLVVAVANVVVALRLPLLELLWQRDVDHGVCCFGLHDLPDRPGAIISHGELSITRLDYDGRITWQCDWREIFTGPFEVCGDVIRAVDFNGVTLTISVETGEILRIEKS